MAVTLPIGFNFRDTSGFVTDASPDVFGKQHYDSGDGFGFRVIYGDPVDNGGFVDRDDLLNPKLAGIVKMGNGLPGQAVFQVDLPAPGDYAIRLAAGDSVYNMTNGGSWTIYDDTTPLSSFDDATFVGGGEWLDATGAVRSSAADWLTNNEAIMLAFATTTFVIEIASGSAPPSGETFLAHLSIEAVGGGSGSAYSKRLGGVPGAALIKGVW